MAAPIRIVAKRMTDLFRDFRGLSGMFSYRGLMSSSYLRNSETNNEYEYAFDEKILEFIVCPLSKRPLRYSKETNELICDDINVAYPIVNGIPNLVPQDARKLQNDNDTASPSQEAK